MYAIRSYYVVQHFGAPIESVRVAGAAGALQVGRQHSRCIPNVGIMTAQADVRPRPSLQMGVTARKGLKHIGMAIKA